MSNFTDKLDEVLGSAGPEYVSLSGAIKFDAVLNVSGEDIEVKVQGFIQPEEREGAFVDKPEEWVIEGVTNKNTGIEIPYEIWKDREEELWQQYDYPTEEAEEQWQERRREF